MELDDIDTDMHQQGINDSANDRHDKKFAHRFFMGFVTVESKTVVEDIVDDGADDKAKDGSRHGRQYTTLDQSDESEVMAASTDHANGGEE